jgi:aryl-alcohol dehydrogenase-like predicted oxidoreductase
MIKTVIEAEILPYCGVHNIGVVRYSPMQAGCSAGSSLLKGLLPFLPTMGEKGIQIS